jgi:hypothetical protein
MHICPYGAMAIFILNKISFLEPRTQNRVRSAFYTQSPSFLAYQPHRQQTQGQNNACPLLGVEQLPCNNQVRHLLEPLLPRSLDGVSLEVFEGLDHQGLLSQLRGLGTQVLLALDGTSDFSSEAMHSQTCLRRQASKGRSLAYQSAITPVIVCPGRSEVMAWPPECIRPQDGPDQQDCERVAGKRWLDTHATQVAPDGVP